MPRLAPVTSATRPSRSILNSSREEGRADKVLRPQRRPSLRIGLVVDRPHSHLVVTLPCRRSFGGDLIYALQVLAGQLYLRGGSILFEVLAAFGAGDGDDVLPLVQEPREGELPRSRALLGGDLLD